MTPKGTSASRRYIILLWLSNTANYCFVCNYLNYDHPIIDYLLKLHDYNVILSSQLNAEHYTFSLFFFLTLLLLLSLLQCSVIGWIHVSSHFSAVWIRSIIGWCSNPTPPSPTTHLLKQWRRWVAKQMCASGGAALLGRRRRRRHSRPPKVTEHQHGDSRAARRLSLPLIHFHSKSAMEDYVAVLVFAVENHKEGY